MEAGLGVELAAGEGVGLRQGLAQALEVAVGVIVVSIDDAAGGVRDLADGDEVVGLEEGQRGAPFDREGLVGALAVGVAGLEDVRAVVFEQDVLAVVERARSVAPVAPRKSRERA